MNLTLPLSRNWLHSMQMKIEAWKRESLRSVLFLLAVMLCGLLFGAVVAGQLNASVISALSQTMSQFLLAVQGHRLVDPGTTFWQRSFAELKVFGLIWLSGVSLLGLPVVTIVLFVRTFSIGFSVAYAVLQFGWHGLVVASLVVFVHQLLALTCLWLAGVTALRFSSTVVHRAFTFSQLPATLSRYTAVIFVCFIGACIAALYQAYVAPSVLLAVLG